MPNPTTMRKRNGVSNIEFALVLATLLAPILMGVFVFGASLVREVQAIQVAREVSELYSRNIDFSRQSNQDIVTQYVAAGLNLRDNGGNNVTGGGAGNGLIILSTYQMNPDSGTTNYNKIVVTKRVMIGNQSLYTSIYGNPPAADLGADGSVMTSPTNYQDTDTAVRASNVANIITLNSGETVRMVEVYFKTVTFSLSSLSSGGGHYSRAIF